MGELGLALLDKFLGSMGLARARTRAARADVREILAKWRFVVASNHPGDNTMASWGALLSARGELEKDIVARVDRDRAALGEGWQTDLWECLKRGRELQTYRSSLFCGHISGPSEELLSGLADRERGFQQAYERVVDQQVWGL